MGGIGGGIGGGWVVLVNGKYLLRPMVRVTRAEALMSAILMRKPMAKIPSTQGPPRTRP
jgi:hypothetical protein